ncbi:MAG: hypothetical protein H6825_06805 [Planctomycetes bacterium]|nr:hypothetical protein [Planctomycetota bacterium]
MRTQLHRLVHHAGGALLLGCVLAGSLDAQTGTIVQVDPTRAGGSDGVGGIEHTHPGIKPGPAGGANAPGGKLPPPKVGSAAPQSPPATVEFADHALRDLGHALDGARGAPRLGPATTASAPSAADATTGVPADASSETSAAEPSPALRLDGALPDAPALLVLGLDTRSVPFRGGVLVPSPDLLLSARTDADGSLELPLPVLPDDLAFCVQIWIADAAGPRGASASNALLVVPAAP